MNDSITNRQIALMLFAVVVGYGVINLPNITVEAVGTGAWIPLAMNTLIIVVFTYIISQLGYNNENETLYEYGQRILGKTMGKIINIIYSIYFLIILSYLVRAYSEILTSIFLPRTPVWAISLLLLFVTAYALTKGLGTIARLTEIYVTIVILGFILIQIIVATLGKIVNIRPILGSEDFITYAKASWKLLLPFIGVEILMFIPMNKVKNKKVPMYSILTIIFIGLLYIFVVESTMAVVGVEDLLNYNASVLRVLMGIDLTSLEILRRLDGFYVNFWTMNLFCDVCIISYLILSQSKKLFTNTSSNMIIFFIIIIAFILSQMPKSPREIEIFPIVITILGVLTLIVIPLILFITMKVKNNEK